MVGTLLLGIALVAYLGSVAACIAEMVGAIRSTPRYSLISAFAGLLIQGTGLALIGIEQHRLPFASIFESLAFASWIMMLLYVVNARKHRIEALGTFAGLIAAGMIGASLTLPKTLNPILLKYMSSPWSAIHITASLFSYAAFLLSAGAAVGYIIQEHMLKTKRINTVQKYLPSLDELDHTAYTMATFGFVMLTLGMICGSLWAATAWGSYWNWDGKETWSLVTWLVYAAYLHTRMLRGWRGKWSNRLLLAGLACVIITYIGITFIATSRHNL